MTGTRQDGEAPGSPRATARAELAQEVRPLLESFMADHGGSQPEKWSELLPWVIWCLADGAVDAALLVVGRLPERRIALVEIVAPTSAPLVRQVPRRPALELAPVALFLRRTPAWGRDHDKLFADLDVEPVQRLPEASAPEIVDSLRWSAGLALVRRVG